mmetsp:Transcript_40263/g.83858  ORF Transcript_40263/g.83858 Transcript_40263/m.83858 type:complete len:136 (-) Transcript_40263:82-489(-)
MHGNDFFENGPTYLSWRDVHSMFSTNSQREPCIIGQTLGLGEFTENGGLERGTKIQLVVAKKQGPVQPSFADTVQIGGIFSIYIRSFGRKIRGLTFLNSEEIVIDQWGRPSHSSLSAGGISNTNKGRYFHIFRTR